MPTDQFMLDKLAASGLLPEDVDATLVVDKFNNVETENFRLPYFRPDAQSDFTLTPPGRAPHHPEMWRIRLARPMPGQGKYTQPSVDDIRRAGLPATDATHPYLNPYILGGMTWAALAAVENKQILIVEGELKAASAGKLLGRAAIGIPGCWGGTVRDEKGIFVVHPVLKGLLRPTDKIEVVLDGDILTNADVNRAAGTLKRALARVGLKPVFVLLPAQPPGVGAGLDDWLMRIPAPDRKQAFAALPRVDGEDFAEDAASAAEAYKLAINVKTGLAWPHLMNVRKLIETHPHFTERYYYDVLRGNLYRTDAHGVRPFLDSFVTDEVHWFHERFGMQVPKQVVTDSLYWMADQPKFHRNLLLESLPVWDAVPRLEEMFINGWGADDNAYTRALGKNWLVSAVARAVKPGCKVDTMLVLVGQQGIKKSMSLEALAGKGLYVATHAQVSNKDFILSLHRGWIIDLAELSSMNHADAAQIKGIITDATDNIRPPYGAAIKAMDRHSVLVGTTNEERFLRDTTGNRRFWPVGCGTISIPWINANRAQLLAEALAKYNTGQTWWDMPQAETEAVQDSRLEISHWEEPLRQHLSANERTFRTITVSGIQYRYITTEELFDALGVEVKFRKPHMARDIAAALRRVTGGAWQPHQYRGIITLSHGGTVDVSRGHRKVELVPPDAKVLPFPQKQNPF